MEESRPAEPHVFHLSADRRELVVSGSAVPIQPKALDLLVFLVEQAGRIVSRAELVEGVWDGLAVSGDAVRYAMKELRRALGDPASDSTFVETVSRRGWRFIGVVGRGADGSWHLEARAPTAGPAGLAPAAENGPFVGRDAELARLHDLLARARDGHRETIFLRGAAGIGKTRLLEHFLATASRRADVLCAQGECADRIGRGVPYAPLFSALERICEQLGRVKALAVFRRVAPTWLAQMPGLTEPEERLALDARSQGATQARMVREWSALVEQLALDRTLVIAIEDLQWADPSTIDALFFAARRTDPARVLLLATFRPMPAGPTTTDLNPEIDELVVRDQARLIEPGPLAREAIAAYLDARFGADAAPARSIPLREKLEATSAGNPLFLVSLVDEYVDRGVIRRRETTWTLADTIPLEHVPARIAPLIETQLGGLEPALRRLLDAASLAGMDFCAAEIAAAVGESIDEVEALCDGLVVDGRFVVADGALAWPDGTVSSRYRFAHALHRQALRGALSPGAAARLSRSLGARLRAAYAGQEGTVAAKLGLLYEQGLDPVAAAPFFFLAGEASAKRFSNTEAAEHFHHVLELLASNDVEDQSLLEIRTRLAVCAPLASISGYASKALEANLAKIEALTVEIEDSAAMFPAILGIWSLHFVRADFARTDIAGDRMLALARNTGAPALRLQAHQSAGHAAFYQGRVAEAQAHYAEATRDYDLRAHARQDYSVGDDPMVLVLACQSLSKWFLGATDAACASAEEAVRLGVRLDHPPSLALARTYGAVLHQLRGDAGSAREWSERSLEITTREGIALWRALSQIVHGWSRAAIDGSPTSAREGVDEIRAGLAGWEQTGSTLGLPHLLLLLAESLGRLGEVDEALVTTDRARALADTTRQHLFDSEVHRVEGDLYAGRATSMSTSDPIASDQETARVCYARAAEEAARRGLVAPQLQARLAFMKSLPRASIASDEEFLSAREELARSIAACPERAMHDLYLAQARVEIQRA